MRRRPAVLLLLAGSWACADTPTALPEAEPTFARGATAQKVDFTITDAGMSLVSDGKGIYQHGVCGVVGSWSDIIYLAPAEGTIPKAQRAACTGIAPRAARLTLAVRHLSDDPHVDETVAPAGSGTFAVSNVKFGLGAAAATTINVASTCETVGLRLTSVTYPGTDDVVRVDLGGGRWRMSTKPWPANRAYCLIGGVPTYWHVDFDLNLQIK